MIIRFAMRMGYHRDGSHFPQISAYQAEMQRRIWAFIVQYDALSSIRLGLPRTIRESDYDTAAPSNFFDGDFHEDDEMLPLARPDSVSTPAQCIVTKSNILAVYGRISDLTIAGAVPSPNEIMALDMSLHNIYASIPPGLRMMPLSEPFNDAAEVIIRRIYIALLYYEAKTTLHKVYTRLAITNPHRIPSRKVCIESALQILEYQLVLEEETKAGGRLNQDRRQTSPLARHSFLLATSILCLDLDSHVSGQPIAVDHDRKMDAQEVRQVVKALENSYRIWEELRLCTFSEEAAKAAEAIKLVLRKARIMDASYFYAQNTEAQSAGMLHLPLAHPKILCIFDFCKRAEAKSNLRRFERSLGNIKRQLSAKQQSSANKGSAAEHTSVAGAQLWRWRRLFRNFRTT